MKNYLIISIVLLFSFGSFAQGIYNDGARVVCEPGSYWTVDNGNFTLTSADKVNPTSLANLKIEADASLIITSASCLTVTGTLTNNNATGGVLIKSDASGTGSIIMSAAAGEGIAKAERWMTAGAWHYTASPLSGQAISDFLETNPIAASSSFRGMMDFNPTSNSWSSFYTNAKDGNLETGKGFSMRVQGLLPENDAALSFTGHLQAGTLTAGVSAGWNCIGNPFTSAIRITHDKSVTDNFLEVNADVFNSSYAAIYVWNNGDEFNTTPGKYTTINNVTPPYQQVQLGQAFMVNPKPGSASFSFTKEMQIHSPESDLKSAGISWPIIEVKAAVNQQVGSSTIIAFNSAMTKGLDPTYDAGLLKGTSDLIVYSRLVEDNGIPFAIQALPTNDFSKMVIPIGLDFKTGGEIVFSAGLFNLPTGCKAILEDKVTKTFTDLSTEVYKVTIPANSSIDNRFQLHTGDLISGLDQLLPEQLTAYAVSNVEIRIAGSISDHSVATLYDSVGKEILSKNLHQGTFNSIPAPNLKQGLYILSVKENEKLWSFKILIRP